MSETLLWFICHEADKLHHLIKKKTLPHARNRGIWYITVNKDKLQERRFVEGERKQAVAKGENKREEQMLQCSSNQSSFDNQQNLWNNTLLSSRKRRLRIAAHEQIQREEGTKEVAEFHKVMISQGGEDLRANDALVWVSLNPLNSTSISVSNKQQDTVGFFHLLTGTTARC